MIRFTSIATSIIVCAIAQAQIDLRTPQWLDATQTSGSIIVHVSKEASADDSNPGTVASPIRTLSEAWLRVTDSQADWILHRRGDAWSDETYTINKSGASPTQPIVIGAYGSGPRPIFETSSGAGSIQQMDGGGVRANVLIRSIRFQPVGWISGNLSRAPQNGIGLRWVECSNYVIEDCTFEGFRLPLQITLSSRGGPIAHKRIVIRACHFTENTNHVLTDWGVGNLFEYCTLGPVDSGMNHAIYDQDNNVNTTIRRCFFWSIEGNHVNEYRSVDAVVDDNYFIDCNDMGSGKVNVSITESWCTIRRNVIDTPRPRRSQFVMQSRGGGPTLVEHNLWVNGVPVEAMSLRRFSGETGNHDVTIRGNLAIGMSRLLDIGGNEVRRLVVSENRSDVTLQVIREGAGNSASEVTMRDNIFFTSATSNQFSWNGSSLAPPAFFATFGDTTSVFRQSTFTDDSRDGLAYIDMIRAGTGSTIADMASAFRANSMASWNPNFTSVAVNTWIQTGFDMPVTSGAPPIVQPPVGTQSSIQVIMHTSAASPQLPQPPALSWLTPASGEANNLAPGGTASFAFGSDNTNAFPLNVISVSFDATDPAQQGLVLGIRLIGDGVLDPGVDSIEVGIDLSDTIGNDVQVVGTVTFDLTG